MLAGSLVELLLFSVPSLVYRAMLRRRGVGAADAWAAIGLRRGGLGDYGAAALVMTAMTGLGAAALRMIPATSLTQRGVSVGAAHNVAGYLGIAALALAEEILFRGLLAEVLIRLLGFGWGNTAQALVFFAPHCLLLLASFALWPILPVQFVAGWLLGWLRHRSGSIGPAWLAHAGSNILAAMTI
jgi:membrane protease YdiL (CAAX protease family)